MLSSEAIVFPSNIAGARKSKGQTPLQVNLGSPFRILLDVDGSRSPLSDISTPSPLSICFDFKKSSSPLRTHVTTAWSDFHDSDSDSDEEEEADGSDASQYITILSDSPFYAPRSPPTFQVTFELPPLRRIPFACQALKCDEKSAADLFHAEFERILPSEVMQELFLVDEESLQGMDDELYSAPLDAFMDVCLARLSPATPSTDVPATDSDEQDAPDAAVGFPSFLVVDPC
ncbi:hypothetical protein B0H17DRAFT_1208742 [Mycena rosella]|uniref:Uncharacterized protein n=1 Tax=Mycena rosella TaxID=1033263 RepID=A0AAD7G984_MYCRO|nr:hypothetical protein B0H17DRAFT_1208742 [Mycena rosella]